MMQRSGSADLALFSGPIPGWLFERMTALSGHVVEAIVQDQGAEGFLARLSDPFWFQSFGAVIGMDWNSSGVTTAVMAALKRSLNPRAAELGLYVCGGKGKDSMQTPLELLAVAERTGLDGDRLAYLSRLTAKLDNTAVQDGFNIYLHSFVLARSGAWSVVQQGMNTAGAQGLARRYHWHSAHVRSFVAEPHSAVCGENQGEILNLVAADAAPTQAAMLQIAQERPEAVVQEMRRLVMPGHKQVSAQDVDLKRLGTLLALAQEADTGSFENLLMLRGMGPRAIQSLALVAEVIHGTPARFADPARFSLAHGGKGGRPFPVPVKVYDQTIATLKTAVERARIGQTDKAKALEKLVAVQIRLEQNFTPAPDAEARFDHYLAQEQHDSPLYGGRTAARPTQSEPGTEA